MGPDMWIHMTEEKQLKSFPEAERTASESSLKIRVFSLVTIPSTASFSNLSIVCVTPSSVAGGNVCPCSSFLTLMSLWSEVPQLFPRSFASAGKGAITNYVNFLAVLAAVKLGQTQRQCCSMRCVHISHVLLPQKVVYFVKVFQKCSLNSDLLIIPMFCHKTLTK